MIGEPIMTSVGETSKSLQTGQCGTVIMHRGNGQLSYRFSGGEGSELEARFGDDTRLLFVVAAYDNATGTTEQRGDERSLGAVLSLVK